MNYQNRQYWSECQLVSVWNAARFLGIEDVPELGSKRYKDICEQHFCINGCCLGTKKEMERIGLKKVKGKRTLAWVKKNLPVEASIDCHQGFHSVLIVGVKQSRVLITNYTRGRLQWLRWTKFKSMMRADPKSFKKRGNK